MVDQSSGVVSRSFRIQRILILILSSGSKNIHFEPFLLTTFVRTLALILHASGSNTLSLPQMTSEFWDLLLSLRSNSSNDTSIQEAILFSLLTLLDINEDKRTLVNRHSKELLETQEWVQMVFESSAGGDKEGDRVRMLAAGLLLRCKEVVDKYQRLLVGDMVDY
jgi:telomere length regulation protein